MMNRLRLFETFDLKDYERFTYQKLPMHLIKACKTALKQGLLDTEAWKNNAVKTTEKGKLFLNELLELFLP
jgi:oxygen-independent coproporphyrinogen-3 oxidase